MNSTPRPHQIITIVSGLVMFIFSFFAWYKVSRPGFSRSTNAWSKGFVPLATFVPVFGLLAAGVMAAAAFGNVRLPEPVIGFTWRQIHFILAFTALVIAVGFLLVDTGGADKSFGLWLCLIGSIGLMVGAVMALLEGGNTSTGRGGTSESTGTPF